MPNQLQQFEPNAQNSTQGKKQQNDELPRLKHVLTEMPPVEMPWAERQGHSTNQFGQLAGYLGIRSEFHVAFYGELRP